MNRFQSISGLTAGHGAVLDIDRKDVEGKGKIVLDERFSVLDVARKEGIIATNSIRIAVKEIIGNSMSPDEILLGIHDGKHEHEASVDMNKVRVGGNAINATTVTNLIEELLTPESHTYIYGPLSEVIEAVLESSAPLPIRNSLKTRAQRQAMPTRVSIIDESTETHLKHKPNYTKRMQEDLRFLMEAGVLIPKTNGDLILSSCINSPFFWNQISDYLKANPQATLYFLPGSVHLGKIVEGTRYMPRDLAQNGKIVVILNTSEIDKFVHNLESHDMPFTVDPMRNTKIFMGDNCDNIDEEEKDNVMSLALQLRLRGIRDVVVTSGPGQIINLVGGQKEDFAYITKPQDRNEIDNLLQEIGIKKSKQVYPTGCGDTFTGAYIALSRLYPDANRNILLETASIFSAIQTHNPDSNLGSLNLEPLKKVIIEKLGEPKSTPAMSA